MYRDKSTNNLVFSPSDLTRYWESVFASWMDRNELENPGMYIKDEDDGMNKVLQTKGYEHEDATIAKLRAEGREILVIDQKSKSAREETFAAMKQGVEIIFQARLQKEPFAGWADFLVRVDGVSNLGDYHYEVWDTKLASKLKPYFVIQLSAYCEMLEEVQGRRPDSIVVVLGTGESRRLRLADYYYYYQSVKKAFLQAQEEFDPNARPDPEKYRSFGSWETAAAQMLVEQDALIQVAGLNSNQVKNLKRAGINTMADLAATSLDRIPKMSDAVFTRLKIQAELQIKSRGKDVPEYIVRNDNETNGLFLLPPENKGDVFFDIEGFPVIDGGLEYLWGNTWVDENGEKQFTDFWAHNPEEEKQAFEEFIDWVMDRYEKYPDMHVYHYANYEIAAIRKLMGRYGTREQQVDHLLRNHVFVDLYNVVRHGLYVGEPRYSIKNIEKIYRGKRQGDVTDGGASVEAYNDWRNEPDGKTWEDSKILKSIRDYNIDDCDSTMELAQWLRVEQENKGIPPFPGRPYVEEKEDEIPDLPDLVNNLLKMVEKYPEAELLAHLTGFHVRESKPGWWRFFDRLATLPDDLFDDPECLAGLKLHSDPEKEKRSWIACYQFDPDQDCKIKVGDRLVGHHDDTISFQVTNLCLNDGFVELKTSKKEGLLDTLTIIPKNFFNQKAMILAVVEFCREWFANPRMQHPVVDFLLRHRPRLKDDNAGALVTDSDSLVDEVIDVARRMDRSFLCIQGPPGAGKTYTAEHMISTLVQEGYKVGITSNSHKAINNLMVRAHALCTKKGIRGKFVKVNKDPEDDAGQVAGIDRLGSSGDVVVTDDLKILSGTAWLFCRDEVADSLDYLFVDEAGQVSIANLIAMSRSCRNVIVMGDQMQLSQPIQGSHPGESGMSVLDYFLQDQATIPDELGIFLPRTWRMHSALTSFISNTVYEGRLKAAPVCDHQEVDVSGSDFFSKRHGIEFVPVVHDGNSQASDEEVVKVVELARDLVGRNFTDQKGQVRKLDWDDLLFVAPYNLQVRKLKEALGGVSEREDVKVGSVDKFQGQEAPVVILSMCSSDASAGFRGIDFLFSRNRLNVALSRAQALAVVVGHPDLEHTYASSVESMAKVNMFCRLLRESELPAGSGE